MNELIEIKHLLANVASISKKYEEIAKITGENFNIFSILSMERREVKTHSAFLGELLNPDGSHGLGDIPLKLFISHLKGKFESDLKVHIADKFDLDFTSCKTEVEKYEGFINEDYTQGGRIDIIIKDCNSKCILIENKIDAYEQPKQLIRYNNAYPNAPILFLTLSGYDSVSADKLIKDEHYFLISYQDDIIEWLKLCLKEAVEFPMLREVIKQYINLVKRLTNQTENNKMKEEIIKSILSNPDNVKAAFEISQNIEAVKIALMERIKLKLQKINSKYEFTGEFGKSESEIKYLLDNEIYICAYFNYDFDELLIGVYNSDSEQINIEASKLLSTHTFISEFKNTKPWYLHWQWLARFDSFHNIFDYTAWWERDEEKAGELAILINNTFKQIEEAYKDTMLTLNN